MIYQRLVLTNINASAHTMHNMLTLCKQFAIDLCKQFANTVCKQVCKCRLYKLE